MKVTPIASAMLFGQPTGYQGHNDDEWPQSCDELAEMAGRACYQSWSRPNPKTATNQGYLANILEQGHYSVLEHASITFYVEGVSRALLTELERHRFLSFSVISQRYVDGATAQFVVPPALRDSVRKEHPDKTDDEITAAFQEQDLFDDIREAYTDIYETLSGEGLPKKQAREAARAVLPNATETKFVVTGNIRCWRDVIGKRYHTAADAEIREFATEVLKHLRQYAPNSVQDIPTEPYS